MKKLPVNSYKHYLCLCIISTIGFAANAQKLPNIQQQSLRAPAGAKADGKADEWGKQLQAYNHNTEIYYTIANNDDRLFFTVHIKDRQTIKKVLIGGITFTVNNSGKKDDKENIIITYPLIKSADGSSIGIKLSEPVSAADSSIANRQTDSIARLMNMDYGNKAKEIKIKGIKQIVDTLISVYNEEDIKAIARFDSKRAFVYELAIPLKYLGISIEQQAKFHYNVMLNGLDKSNITMFPSNNSRGLLMVVNTPKGLSPESSSMSLNYPTDFWGEYVLAK